MNCHYCTPRPVAAAREEPQVTGLPDLRVWWEMDAGQPFLRIDGRWYPMGAGCEKLSAALQSQEAQGEERDIAGEVWDILKDYIVPREDVSKTDLYDRMRRKFPAPCQPAISEAKKETIVHGVNCPKAEHKYPPGGYLHGELDDSPFDDDGVKYCGRCHHFLTREGEKPGGEG